MKIQEKLIFNEKGNDDVSLRKIINGDTTGLFQLNDVKYNWATKMYQVMIGNFWVPEKVQGLKEDALQYKNVLSKSEREAYNGVLSFLIFLDSIQTVNLPHFSDYITAPEVNLLLAIQSFQEGIHSQSYAVMLESITNTQERQDIYYFWRDDKILLDRNLYIGNIYQEFKDNPNDKTFFKGIIGNLLLEGLYFYNGFAFFDTLADQGKMRASDRMINYIKRDELTHIVIFSNIIKEIKREYPEMFDKEVVYDMFDTAVKQEIEWSHHILGNKIPGITKGTTIEYTKHLANIRLKQIGLEPLYKDIIETPYKHLERMDDQNSQRVNFFDSTVSNYTQSSSMKGGWDF